jgi:cysteinyl-tRNA synthetase
MSFSWEAMDAAQTGLERLRRQVFELGPAGTADPGFVERFRAEVNDDLQFPKALALVWEVLKSPLPSPAKKATVLAFDQCLGLKLAEWSPAVETIPAEVEALARERLAARQARNWAESDRLRGAIAALGFAVEDGAGTYKVVRKPTS